MAAETSFRLDLPGLLDSLSVSRTCKCEVVLAMWLIKSLDLYLGARLLLLYGHHSTWCQSVRTYSSIHYIVLLLVCYFSTVYNGFCSQETRDLGVWCRSYRTMACVWRRFFNLHWCCIPYGLSCSTHFSLKIYILSYEVYCWKLRVNEVSSSHYRMGKRHW